MASNLKDIKKDLKQYRSDKPRGYSDLKVIDFKVSKPLDAIDIKASVGVKQITYIGAVRSEMTNPESPDHQDIYKVSVRFGDIVFHPEKMNKTDTAIIVNDKTYFYEVPSVGKNKVSLKCQCQNFRFDYEWQLYQDKALIGNWRRYKRLTPPAVRPANPTNPNPIGHDFVNPDNYLGYCKHIHNFLKVLAHPKVGLLKTR